MLRLFPLVALALLVSACSSGDPVDDDLDPFTSSLTSLAAIDGFGGIALDGDDVTLYTLGERPSARAAAEARLGSGTALTVVALPADGRGSESLKHRVPSVVSRYASVDFDETTGYVRVGFRDVDALRLAQHELVAFVAADREAILLHLEPRSFTY